MSSRPPKPHRTRQLTPQQIERVVEAAKNETCLECALHQSEKESWRLERHRLHTRIGDLEARLTMISQVVNQLHDKVSSLTDVSHG